MGSVFVHTGAVMTCTIRSIHTSIWPFDDDDVSAFAKDDAKVQKKSQAKMDECISQWM